MLRSYIDRLMELGISEQRAFEICGEYADNAKAIDDFIKISGLFLNDKKQYPKGD